MPHTGLWEKAGLYKEALAFNMPMKVCEFGKQEGIFETEKSFIEIEGENLILSSVTKSEDDTVIIRLYNPTECEIKGRINLGFDVKEARSIRLDGKKKEKLKIKDNSIDIKVGNGKIYTVEVM